MKNHKKLLLIASAIILLAAGCNKAANTDQQQEQQQQQTENQQVTSTPPSQPQVQVPAAPKVLVTQSVQGSNLNNLDPIQIPEGENAIDALKRGHQVETKEYSGIGEMVTGIDGLKPDSRHFWAFYVNGQLSSVGAGQYKPKNGDKIEWKMDTINSYK